LAGTNSFTVLATDAAGNVSTNSFSVIQGSVGLTVTPLTQDQMKYAYATVWGTVDDPGCTIAVNGMPGTNCGNGTWVVDNAPLPLGGTVTLQATAYLSGPGPIQVLLTQQRDPIVFTQTYGYELDYSLGVGTTNGSEAHHAQLQWARGVGGTSTQADQWVSADGATVTSNLSVIVWPPDNGYCPCLTAQATTASYSNGVLTASSSNPVNLAPGVEWMEHSSCASSLTNYSHATWSESSGREVRLFTGGNALRQAQGLFDASASLTTESGAYTNTLSDWDVIYWGQAFIPFQPAASPLPPQYVGLGALGTLGNDGHLFKVESSGSEIVMTLTAPAASFTGQLPLVQKHTPYITLSTATTANANLATNTPEVCVGQQVTLTLNGLPTYQQQVGHWILPQKYVNEAWQLQQWVYTPPLGGYWAPYGSLNYRINSDLLTNLTTQCWYVNNSGSTVTAAWNLQFPDGQQVNVITRGSLTVYRPSISLEPLTPDQQQRYYTIDYANDMTCKLKLGEDNESGEGTMRFTVDIRSRYDGALGLTQLITADYSNPVYVFSDERCDGGEWYSGPSGVHGGNYSVPNGAVGFGDGPSDIWVTPNIVSLSCRDFVRFQPVGGIPVTLGILTWETVGVAETLLIPSSDWNITEDATTGPNGPDGSDEFPVWTVNQGGMH
jgi:hypothetical protein